MEQREPALLSAHRALVTDLLRAAAQDATQRVEAERRLTTGHAHIEAQLGDAEVSAKTRRDMAEHALRSRGAEAERTIAEERDRALRVPARVAVLENETAATLSEEWKRAYESLGWKEVPPLPDPGAVRGPRGREAETIEAQASSIAAALKELHESVEEVDRWTRMGPMWVAVAAGGIVIGGFFASVTLETWRSQTMSGARAVVSPALVTEQQAPASSAFISDTAHVLSADTIRLLDGFISHLQEQTGARIVVATVDSIDSSLSRFDYAKKIAQSRETGPEAEFNGVVLVVSIKEREAAMITSGKVRDKLTNERLLDIQNRFVTPQLQQSDYNGAINQGTQVLSRAITQGYDAARANSRGVTNETHRGLDTSASRPAQKKMEERALVTCTIISRPPGAAVVIDKGEQHGTAPFKVTLRPGAHGVQISKEGYKTKLDMVRVGPVAKDFVFDLEPERR